MKNTESNADWKSGFPLYPTYDLQQEKFPSKGAKGLRELFHHNVKTDPVFRAHQQLYIGELADGANAGDLVAQFKLGKEYFNGKWVRYDQAVGVYWYRKAAQQGDGEAMCCLGDAYQHGWGVSKDHDTAFYWYEQSANTICENSKRGWYSPKDVADETDE